MASHVKNWHLEFTNLGGPGTFPVMVPHEEHVEFDEADGEGVAEALLEHCGSKADAFDECLMMLVVAAGKQDMTTISGCMQARRYMRRNGWNKC